MKTKTKVIIGATLTLLALSTWNVGRASTAETSVTSPSASNSKKQPALTLASIRQSIAANEKLLNPIRLRFTDTFEAREEPVQPATIKRQPGRRYSHAEYEWAQKGERHYARARYLYSPDEVARTEVNTVNETHWTSAILPDWAQRSTLDRDELQWNVNIPITVLGLRPFEGDYPLSEILQPSWATFTGQMEEVDGKRVAVVEVKRRVLNPEHSVHKRRLLYPDHLVYYGRFWIDVERGVVLRIRYFAYDAAAQDRHPIGTIEELRHQRLSNGAWLPVDGRRITGNPDHSNIEHIQVEKESITIKSTEIPESLFTMVLDMDARPKKP